MDPVFWMTTDEVGVVTPNFTFTVTKEDIFGVITEFMTLTRTDNDVNFKDLLRNIREKRDYCTDICSLIGGQFTLNYIDDGSYRDDFIRLEYPIPLNLVTEVLERLEMISASLDIQV